MTTMPLPYALVDPDRTDIDLRPTRAHDDDAGLDVRAAKLTWLEPGEHKLVPTGIRVAVPTGTVLDVRPRSGLAHKHGITVLNTPGTIDPGFRGEIKINIINHGNEFFFIDPGDRIAQLVLLPVIYALPVQVEHLDTTARGTGGHGSTGA